MQIVIDIPKSVIEHLKDGSFGARIDDRATLIDAVMSGTPLPEHHGRLIDADALNRKDVNCANVPMNFIDTAPTIIEADRGE